MPANPHIRPAVPTDYPGVWRVAALDSAPAPAIPMLVAEADGVIIAAVSLRSGRTVADPFRPTADVVARLRTLCPPRQAPVRTRGRSLAFRAALAGVRR